MKFKKKSLKHRQRTEFAETTSAPPSGHHLGRSRQRLGEKSARKVFPVFIAFSKDSHN
jgi:hypothetical protein